MSEVKRENGVRARTKQEGKIMAHKIDFTWEQVLEIMNDHLSKKNLFPDRIEINDEGGFTGMSAIWDGCPCNDSEK